MQKINIEKMRKPINALAKSNGFKVSESNDSTKDHSQNVELKDYSLLNPPSSEKFCPFEDSP